VPSLVSSGAHHLAASTAQADASAFPPSLDLKHTRIIADLELLRECSAAPALPASKSLCLTPLSSNPALQKGSASEVGNLLMKGVHIFVLAQQQEAALLEELAVRFSSTYDFVGSSNPSAKQFGELFDALVS